MISCRRTTPASQHLRPWKRCSMTYELQCRPELQEQEAENLDPRSSVKARMSRQYSGSRKTTDLIELIDDKTWNNIKPVAWYRDPNSLQFVLENVMDM
ncbi:hypothetical protein BsWGS_15287 [Bradybaena similaris]